jgi:hypothetical protein
MRIDSAFASDYLKAADLDGKQVVYTITSVKVEEIGQERDQRPVVYFEETEKGLVLNKTNSRTISDEYGLETDDWAGRRIALYEKMVEFSGKEVPAIRVKVAKAKPAARKPVPPASTIEDDDIPF